MDSTLFVSYRILGHILFRCLGEDPQKAESRPLFNLERGLSAGASIDNNAQFEHIILACGNETAVRHEYCCRTNLNGQLNHRADVRKLNML